MLNGRGSQLLTYVLGVSRFFEESAKPAKDRGPGYRDLDKRKLIPKVEEGLDPAKDAYALAQGLEVALEELGPGHPFVAAALAGRTPAEAAKALLEGSRMHTAEARAALLDGGSKAFQANTDSLVVLARKIDSLAAPIRREEEEAQAVIAEHGSRIAKARFQAYGKANYPDATFTLRLSYGKVETYPANGTLMQPFTTFGGLFDRADGWGPEAEDHSWELPPRWIQRRGALDPATPYNLLTSNDIIGGNSGSPLLDRRGDVAGIVFDGNLESIAGRFFFDPKVNRTLAVDGRAILAALEKVYDARHIVTEIQGR
jgi:hypothetical protein